MIHLFFTLRSFSSRIMQLKLIRASNILLLLHISFVCLCIYFIKEKRSLKKYSETRLDRVHLSLFAGTVNWIHVHFKMFRITPHNISECSTW